MRLRPFILEKDFDQMKDWIEDERTNAMWCAGHLSYPVDKESMKLFLRVFSLKTGDMPFVATTDEGRPVGFFCYSLNLETNEGMLKFVVVDPNERGKGTAVQMLNLAAKYAFEITKADVLHLNVFAENLRARKCYEKAGFVERNTTPGAFKYKDESWGRCNMALYKNDESR
jgi:RimJ/RimL family protein N-acetyltransferase